METGELMFLKEEFDKMTVTITAAIFLNQPDFTGSRSDAVFEAYTLVQDVCKQLGLK